MFDDLFQTWARSKRATGVPVLVEGEWNTIFDVEAAGVINHIWMTFPTMDLMFGRRNLLRIFWDDETEPSVEAPLGDFFGLPWGLTGCNDNEPFHLLSKYLVVAEQNGLNCYFKMPFAKHARIEVFVERLPSLGGYYYQIDYHQFDDGLPNDLQDMRFHSQFRFENPCENYGRNYLFLDAEGKGALIGAIFAIEINEPQLDGWYHGGGDTILIDGESRSDVLHGIGAEDFFGHSWGVRPFSSPLIGTTYSTDNRVAMYRFFDEDCIVFRDSIRAVIGALGNNYSSVAYWYQTEPHRPFFRTPESNKRMPDSIAAYGTYDVEPQNAEIWKLLAPFPCTQNEPFETVRAFEKTETGEENFIFTPIGVEGASRPSLPGGERMDVRWSPQTAYHNFVDFNIMARPAITCVCLQSEVVGYALKYVDWRLDEVVEISVGFDDELCVRINDSIAFHANHPNGYSEETFKAAFKKGSNRILVKLSNFENTTFKLWGFCFNINSQRGSSYE